MTDLLDSARHHRTRLHAAMERTELALAAASGRDGWRTTVSESVSQLFEAFGAHVDLVEAPDGLLIDLVEDAPRLVHGVNTLRQDHDVIAERLAGVKGRLPDLPVADLREELTEILGMISRHRQLGADMVYEAYNADIGGTG